MSRFAPVCPPQMAGQLKQLGLLGDYHLLLAHDIAEQPEEYSKVFKDLQGATLILDNSVIEIGYAAADEVVATAYAALQGGGSEIITVLPDCLGDWRTTAELSAEAAVVWEEKGIKPPYMAVPQGNTRHEFQQCAHLLARLPNVTYWGIPRYLTKVCETRQWAIDVCRSEKPGINIHLLGFSDDLLDDVACARRTEVTGIDSAVPLRMGMISVQMSLDNMYNTVLPPRQPNWWQAASVWELHDRNLASDEQVESTVVTNLKTVRQWISKK